MGQRVFVRHGHAPLLTPHELPYHTNAVLNPGVAEMDGEVVLLLRVESREAISHLRAGACSTPCGR